MYRINHSELIGSSGPLQAQTHALPAEIGKGKSSSYRLDTDLIYIDTHYQVENALSIRTQTDDDSAKMVLTISLSGCSNYASHNSVIDFKTGYATLTAFRSSQGERNYAPMQTVRQLRFVMTPQWLQRYDIGLSQQVLQQVAPQLLNQQKLSADSLIAAQRLTQLDPLAPMCLAYMHGHSLAILGAELTGLLAGTRRMPSDNPKLKAIAETARELLIAELTNPPSVAELAQRVGVNSLKLQRLFHQYFNNTPYGVLTEYKMQQAYYLLQHSQRQISQIAYELGYKHPNNFTTAFIRYYGVSPKQIQKK